VIIHEDSDKYLANEAYKSWSHDTCTDTERHTRAAVLNCMKILDSDQALLNHAMGSSLQEVKT
jgi:hypothetical protein